MPGSTQSTTRLRQASMSIRLAGMGSFDRGEYDNRIPGDMAARIAATSKEPRCSHQLALPLRTSVSRHNGQIHVSHSNASYGESEDMLRRKTPSGTLNAAYNGTFAESDVKPHASKHLLLPQASIGQTYQCVRRPDIYKLDSQSTDFPFGTQSDAQLWSAAPVRSSIASQMIYSDHTSWGPQVQHGAMDWQYTLNPPPQVLQPPYQPPLGPTASHTYLTKDAPYKDSAPFAQYASNNGVSPLNAWTSYQQAHNTEKNTYSDTACDAQMPFDSLHHFIAPQQLFAPIKYQSGNPYGHWAPSYAHTCLAANTAYDGHAMCNPPFRSPSIDTYWEAPHSPDHILSRAFGIYRDLLAAMQQGRASTDRQKYSKPTYSRRDAHAASFTHSSQESWPSTTADRKGGHQHRDFDPTISGIPGSQDRRVGVSESRYDSFDSAAVANTACQSAVHAGQNQGRVALRSENGYTPIWGQFSNRQWSSMDDLRYAASDALKTLNGACEVSDGSWKQGMLLNGCLSYVLGEYDNAVRWYGRMLEFDPGNVEATSNLAATYLAQSRRKEAEYYWRQAIRLRPTYFEAIEQLVQLLCFDRRQKEAVQVIENVQTILTSRTRYSQESVSMQQHPVSNISSAFQVRPTSRYACSSGDNGRLMALIHAKANMLYNMHDEPGAAGAFEEVILVAVGQYQGGIDILIRSVLAALSVFAPPQSGHPASQIEECLLLSPEKVIQTAKLCFPYDGDLPGLKSVHHSAAKKAAVSLASNSLLSLAKISQDGMNPNASPSPSIKSHHGVRDILAMYYLSLSLQPSPSTANNVGILLASVQQANENKASSKPVAPPTAFTFAGVVPGSGIALALTYYKYGLNLDSKHAHLFTNLGSLLKDIGQLPLAVQMYEKAVQCDPRFDIALANLANAVKDQGKVGDAIKYYQKAVDVNPGFAEAVCGLANSLNSICAWRGRGGMTTKKRVVDRWHVDQNNVLCDANMSTKSMDGWVTRVLDIVETQLDEAQSWGRGVLQNDFIDKLSEQLSGSTFTGVTSTDPRRKLALLKLLTSWKGRSWEGAKIVWLIERATRYTLWRWYQDRHVTGTEKATATYVRPKLPDMLPVPGAPTILPFHTFTLPVDAKQVRLISQRNGLRVSCSTLRSSWLPPTVFVPPKPPAPQIHIGYVSSDFNNHPLAHLMQSVFGMHNQMRIRAHCYATTVSDNSVHRQQIERETHVFHDASNWSTERLVNQISNDGIHILVNLNGYTRGARNEIFAARPAPIQMSFMGFAGSLGAEWCDYLLADETAIPQNALRPSRRNVDLDDLKEGDSTGGNDDWVYAENIIYTRDTFFCCDHRQSGSDASAQYLTWSQEQQRRWAMRKDLFPSLPDDAVIFGNFNQLYKIDPTTFRTWLRILSRVPRAYLWLLRFPADGATHLISTAHAWAGAEVASRILFTDVAPKAIHIARGCIADLFLDTPECNAHTTAADCLWSGTPLLTLPRYEWKMCSRMAAGILGGALDRQTEAGREAWDELVASSEEEYEDRAVRLGNGLVYDKAVGGLGAEGRLMNLRKMIWEGRWSCKLFDTRRWVRDLEVAYEEAWRRWVAGEGGDIWLKDL